jgi:very-short-patch-repair endonuclease
MNQIFNQSKYKQRRQELRKNMPEPEKRVWALLRNQKMGVQFRRQHGIGHYIADFYCSELKLVIEIDGESHHSEAAQQYDQKRDEYMQTLGIKSIRLSNKEVMQNIEGVYQYLHQYLSLLYPFQNETRISNCGGSIFLYVTRAIWKGTRSRFHFGMGISSKRTEVMYHDNL